MKICPNCGNLLEKMLKGHYNKDHTCIDGLPEDQLTINVGQAWHCHTGRYQTTQCKYHEFVELKNGDIYNYRDGSWEKTLVKTKVVTRKGIIIGAYLTQQ